jgi:hypothetical protein
LTSFHTQTKNWNQTDRLNSIFTIGNIPDLPLINGQFSFQFAWKTRLEFFLVLLVCSLFYYALVIITVDPVVHVPAIEFCNPTPPHHHPRGARPEQNH